MTVGRLHASAHLPSQFGRLSSPHFVRLFWHSLLPRLYSLRRSMAILCRLVHMPATLLVPVLFILSYIVPGAALTSNSATKEKRFENFALAILLSLVFAPLTLSLLSRAVPGNDGLLMAGYIIFWALVTAGVRMFPATVTSWLPDFSALPKADKAAWIAAVLLTVIVVSLRIGLFQGNVSKINDDFFNLTKLTSIAATGLPSLYARQPLYHIDNFTFSWQRSPLNTQLSPATTNLRTGCWKSTMARAAT